LQIRRNHKGLKSSHSFSVRLFKWKYAARCSGDANTISVYVESIQPRQKGGHMVQVIPGTQPDNADRTWYNVWYAVCLGEFGKYPRSQEG